MSERTDEQLTELYLRSRDQDAFAELVHRYIHTIYSAARRQVRDPHLAEDVTQTVFILLAQKAHTIRKRASVAGWLFKVTWFVARDALKSKACRFRHEQQVAAMTERNAHEFKPDPDQAWREIAPAIDDAMARLSEIDRSALVLRYLQDKPLAQVAQILHSTEAAAAKRISRALAKLRRFLARRAVGGVAVPTALLAASMATSAAEAAPPALAATVTHAGLHLAPTITASHAAAIFKGAMLSTPKAKAIAIVVVALIGIAVPATIFSLAFNRPGLSAPPASARQLDSTNAPASTSPSDYAAVYGLGKGRMIKRIVNAPRDVRKNYIRALFPELAPFKAPSTSLSAGTTTRSEPSGSWAAVTTASSISFRPRAACFPRRSKEAFATDASMATSSSQKTPPTINTAQPWRRFCTMNSRSMPTLPFATFRPRSSSFAVNGNSRPCPMPHRPTSPPPRALRSSAHFPLNGIRKAWVRASRITPAMSRAA